MSENDKLDEFLKQKLQPREYEFKDAYWEAAEKLIVADQLARKRRRRFFFFFLFGFIGLGSIFAFSYHQSLVSKNSLVSQYRLDEAICENYDYHLAHNTKTQYQLSKTNTSLFNSEESKTQLLEARTPLFTATPKETPPRLPFTSLMKAKSLKKVENENPKNVYRGSGPLTRRKKKHLAFSIKSLKGKGFSLLSQKDGSIIYLNSADEFPNRKRHFVNLSVGNNISLGLQNDQAERAKLNLHPIIGAHYAYELKPGIRFQTGLLYQGRGGLNADTTFKSVNFNFGAETEATTISPQKLHYLEIPLLVDTRIKGRHYLIAGASLSYLINASSKVNRQKLLPFGTEDLGTTRKWGYTQGFNQFDAGLMAGYGYYLNQGIRVGFRARYGLRDITNNGFFNNQAADRNLQIRLVLEYDIFHF